MRLVIAYYVIDDNYEFSYAQLVNLDNDELVKIKSKDDFYKYKGFIYLPDKRLLIDTFTEFLNFLVSKYDSYDDLRENHFTRIVLAAYDNGLKVINIVENKVYSYHNKSIFLNDLQRKWYKDERVNANYNKILGYCDLIKYDFTSTCQMKGKLDVVRSNLAVPWLEMYSCGSGVLLLDKFQSMDVANLVIFPSELEYLVDIIKGDSVHSVIHCDTLMFTTNTKYICGHLLRKFVRFKKLLLSRECVGAVDFVPCHVEYID